MKQFFFGNDSGAARSSRMFAVAMVLAAISTVTALSTKQDVRADALNGLSDTQFLSSQKSQ
ncbi:MAG: hypothetical protein QNI90_05295 [Dinoroseobacter sp.]|nr:hypothetical protein [Dinoroseobacter sp.]MDJ0992967.1 hypothetical protein [Dinoroseobacter sp.]